MTDKFNELFSDYRNKFQNFQNYRTGSSEYNNFERLFREFYYLGKETMKEEILAALSKKMQECNDSVPKTMYNSEKFKTSIKVVKEIL